MKAIEISTFGPPDVLRLTERPAPAAGIGEVLIAVAASGINRPDVLQRKGVYPAPTGVSDLPGLEVAGVIVSGDADALRAAELRIGDRVCALVAGGGYAEICAAPVGQCLPVPAGLTDIEAASLPETYFTVWSNLFNRAGLRSGETLLIHGGSSGIGVAAIQLARAAGATVLVTVGSDVKVAACLALGAQHAINYRSEDFVDSVNRITAGHGVDVILDMVAGDYIARGLNCLAVDGRVVVIAVQGGAAAQFDAARLLMRRLTITGSTLRARSVEFKSAIARELRAVAWRWIEAGRVKPVVFKTFPAAEAAQAHALMESNQHIGKLVLSW